MVRTFSEFSKFKESGKSSIAWIVVNLKILSLTSIMIVSYTGEGKCEPFYCNDKYFCEYSVKHLGKTPLSTLSVGHTLNK